MYRVAGKQISFASKYVFLNKVGNFSNEPRSTMGWVKKRKTQTTFSAGVLSNEDL